MARLPSPLRGEIERLQVEAALPAGSLVELQRLEQLLHRYGMLLDRALALAPELELSFNRLPSRFPDRVAVSGYQFVDVYHHEYQALRDGVYEVIRRIDPEAHHRDRVPRYFDFEERPLLVEVTFRHRSHPMRLQAAAEGLGTGNQQAVGVFSAVRFQLVTLVRPSTPELHLRREGWTGSLLAALRLRRDVELGQRAFDETFLVDMDAAEVRRALTPELCAALLRVAEVDVPTLDVHGGTALLEWKENNQPANALPAALDVLAALRELEPVPLVAPDG